MNGELRVVQDVPGEFSQRVVTAFENRQEEDFSLVLSGGDTARRCYERLAADSSSRIAWWLVDVYWGDERCVPPDDPASNELLARQALLERVGTARSIHPMR
ncbi:MAG TPA: 6-phosphogluconolactonase, partial [Acidimicrobiales bacterium]|nr:6-phosphogluconolactonase [Acidimicrobiales bacterium]